MSTGQHTPYTNQQDKHFWRTGVAEKQLGIDLFESLHDLVLSKKSLNIASVGSCFAQHVGRWLISNHYPFSQSQLDTKRESSFAFGNIYTPKCFLQWLNYNSQDPHRFDIYHDVDTQRYYDLLRPSVYEEGFLSKQALLSSREEAKAELYNTLRCCDTLIFTLGLTEAWKDVDDVFYPSCPGVISGEFDQQHYLFHEFHYQEILSDVDTIKSILQKVNPNINIILTVSPVPLTATATDKHIVVANQYSKSTLRSVAGYLSNTDSSFKYFPSYEIITVNHTNDFRFEKNRRTVSMTAVNYVMEHFKHAFIHNKNTNDMTEPSQAIEKALKAAGEVACEEEQLEAIKALENKRESHSDHNVEILTLIGDSHMGKLSTALSHIGISHAGGMIMNGSGFAEKKFVSCPEEYFVPLENAKSRKLWIPTLNNLVKHKEQGFKQPSFVISNIGLQTHKTITRLISFIQAKGVTRYADITHQEFVAFFQADQAEQLSILLNIKDAGHNVIVISDTPFCQYFEESKTSTDLIYTYYDVLEHILSGFDIPFLNVARIFDSEIKDPMNYLSTDVDVNGYHDWFHGADEYYAWLAEKLMKDVILPVMEN